MKRRRNSGNGQVAVFLGGESSIEGQLVFRGQARLDGKFSGEIKGEGVLIVGHNAIVEAHIEATAVEISGSVVGDIVAAERIELRAPGRLVGNITAPLVVMDEGVVFEGNCRMAGENGENGLMPKVRLLSSEGKTTS